MKCIVGIRIQDDHKAGNDHTLTPVGPHVPPTKSRGVPGGGRGFLGGGDGLTIIEEFDHSSNFVKLQLRC